MSRKKPINGRPTVAVLVNQPLPADRQVLTVLRPLHNHHLLLCSIDGQIGPVYCRVQRNDLYRLGQQITATHIGGEYYDSSERPPRPKNIPLQ